MDRVVDANASGNSCVETTIPTATVMTNSKAVNISVCVEVMVNVDITLIGEQTSSIHNGETLSTTKTLAIQTVTRSIYAVPLPGYPCYHGCVLPEVKS